MSNLNIKFKQILDDLEKNIKNEKDLEYIKVQVFNLYNIFYDEISEREEALIKRMEALASTQATMQEKVESLEKELKSMEKELYIDENSDFTITCPYCNNEFVVECEDLKDEVECPECNNIIELDWGDDLDCEDSYGCSHDCLHCKSEEDEDM